MIKVSNSIELDPADLAPHIRAAIHARYPGAEILEAEMSLERNHIENFRDMLRLG